MVSGPEKILTETENLSQGAEAQYSLSQSFFGSGDREVEFTGLYVSNFRFGVPICFFWISKYEIGTPK